MWSAKGIAAAARQAGVDEVALHVGLVTRRRVFALHQEGLSVSTWTANSPLLMRRLIACGVDVIMTNYPDRLLKLIESAEPGNEHPPDSGARR
jgi:glycerophosphoryl diester phosphodiesterase